MRLGTPDVAEPVVAQLVAESVAAETHDVSAELLLAIAWRESRLHGELVGAHGERGAWQVLPRYGDGSASSVVHLLTQWRLRARGHLRTALGAYNAGNCGLRGKCGVSYARSVLVIERRLKAGG
jgi:hypothetical protein